MSADPFQDHRAQRWKALLPLILLGAGLIVLGLAALLLLPSLLVRNEGAKIEFSAEPAPVSFQAPALSLTDLQGNPVSLQDYAGQVVLVNNWATWCPPCKAEMPVLQAYFEAHRQQNFTLVAIDAGETAESVAAFVTENGLTFPVWLDPDYRAMTAFRNDFLPSSYVMDRQGIIRLAWNGAISLEMLEKHVTPLLEEE